MKKKTKKIKVKKTKKVKRTLKKQSAIIYLIRQFYQIQEHRIAFSGQIRALKEAKLNTKLLEGYYETLHSIEKDIEKELAKEVENHRVWKGFLKQVKGIGPIIAAGLINLIDIKKAKHISSLWKFAGLDVANGQAPRLQKGQKATWNPLMKILCWKVGKSFIMTKSSYRKFYDERKKYERKLHPRKEWTGNYKIENGKKVKTYKFNDMHIHNRAARFMVKRFLSDLWLQWRDIDNLPTSLPYVVAKLGHKFKK